MKLLIAILLAFTLGMSAVSADELWVKNPGALHIQVWSDTPYEDVNVKGCIDASASEDIDAEVMAEWETTGATGMWVAGPGWEPEDGKFEVAAIAIPDPAWIVIEADNITSWNVIESVDGACAWVEPEIYLVTDAQLDAAQAPAPSSYPAPYIPRNHDSGPSIAEVNEPIEYDWTGQEYWLYT